MTLLTTSEEVATFIAAARAEPFVTIDTEFLRTSTYWPQLCLVQIGLKDQAVAIDPLVEGLDMTPVWDLVADPKVLKVFHACKQDMELILHESGHLPAPIYDTQVAAMMLGLGEQIGYDNLIQRVLGRQIDKTSQFSDWSLRPLDTEQLSYALSDVTHLYQAYEVLTAQIAERGRESWVAEEITPLANPASYRVDPEIAWMRVKAKNRSKPFLAALKCLAKWREDFAQARDLPRSRILKDEILVDLAMRRPKNAAAMLKQRGISDGLAHGKTGQAILKALRAAETLPEDQIPVVDPRPAPIPGGAAKLELLRTLLKICADMGEVAPRVLASAADLEALARDPAGDHACLHGWRGELFGQQALALLAGQLWLGLEGGRLAVRKAL